MLSSRSACTSGKKEKTKSVEFNQNKKEEWVEERGLEFLWVQPSWRAAIKWPGNMTWNMHRAESNSGMEQVLEWFPQEVFAAERMPKMVPRGRDHLGQSTDEGAREEGQLLWEQEFPSLSTSFSPTAHSSTSADVIKASPPAEAFLSVCCALCQGSNFNIKIRLAFGPLRKQRTTAPQNHRAAMEPLRTSHLDNEKTVYLQMGSMASSVSTSASGWDQFPVVDP
ncbi:hypothetical protein ACLKA6_014654 [Drosophila palustris]